MAASEHACICIEAMQVSLSCSAAAPATNHQGQACRAIQTLPVTVATKAATKAERQPPGRRCRGRAWSSAGRARCPGSPQQQRRRPAPCVQPPGRPPALPHPPWPGPLPGQRALLPPPCCLHKNRSLLCALTSLACMICTMALSCEKGHTGAGHTPAGCRCGSSSCAYWSCPTAGLPPKRSPCMDATMLRQSSLGGAKAPDLAPPLPLLLRAPSPGAALLMSSSRTSARSGASSKSCHTCACTRFASVSFLRSHPGMHLKRSGACLCRCQVPAAEVRCV